MIAIVSYNPLESAVSFRNSSTEKYFDVYNNIFNPKSPRSVTIDDPVYKQLVFNIDIYEQIIVFVGKKSSGACTMIKLLCGELHEYHEKLFFVLCDHDYEEKVELLEEYKVYPHQYMSFSDNNYLKGKRCDEEVVLLGLITKYISDIDK
jgi:L-rhamnose isomerase